MRKKRRDCSTDAAQSESLVERDLYSIPEACSRLGNISRGALYILHNRKKIGFVKLGRRTFVSAEEIRRVARAQQ
ncbi:MAG: helix-turn-helix domain-containing protein [Rhizobiaceae bacterium]